MKLSYNIYSLSIYESTVVFGIIIGILSVLWLFIMHWTGHFTVNDKVAPFEYWSILIPILGIFFGVRYYKVHDNHNELNFFQGLFQGIKILLIGGLISGFAAIAFISYISKNTTFLDFSGRLFGAWLVGGLTCVVTAIVLMNRTSKID